MTHAFHTCLESLRIGNPLQAENLSLFPLTDPNESAGNHYLTMDRALTLGLLNVSEIGDTGSVPELRVKNLAGQPVMLLDGEELVGAMQNRVLNMTILVPPKSEIVVDVSCVEMGRWSMRSPRFEGSQRAMYARGRAQKAEQINESMRCGSRRSDQRAVWDDIACKADAMQVVSRTLAMSDIYVETEDRRQAYRKILCPKGARGAVFCIDGKPIGIEILDRASSFDALFQKLLDSYAMDAIESRAPERALPEIDAVQRLIDAASAANIEQFPAIGIGEDIRLESQTIVGGGLVDNGRLLQLSAFDRKGHRGPRARRRYVHNRQTRPDGTTEGNDAQAETVQDVMTWLNDEEV